MSLTDIFELCRQLFPGSFLALIRWANSAGSRNWIWFTEFGEFASICRGLPPKTNILLFPKNREPRRGTVGPALLDAWQKRGRSLDHNRGDHHAS